MAKLIFDNTDVEVVLLGKDENFTRFEQGLRSQLPEHMQRRFLVRPTASIEALTASLRGVDGIITVNTSALHLAHALKLPLVALCGSSAEFWLPEGDHVRLVRDTKGVLPPSDQYHHDPLQPSLQRIEVAEVYSAFDQLFCETQWAGRKVSDNMTREQPNRWQCLRLGLWTVRALLGLFGAWIARGSAIFKAAVDSTIPQNSNFYQYTFARFEPFALYASAAFFLGLFLIFRRQESSSSSITAILERNSLIVFVAAGCFSPPA